ncbi:MAG: OmpA family protein, partial [Rhodospirillaceae bacterium]|nr:OmpA family protein [Rhodospirillaceae bacterium]
TMETQRFKDLAGHLRGAFGFQEESLLTGLIEMGGTPTHTAKTMSLPVPVAKILPAEEQAEGEVTDAPQTEDQLADAFVEQSQKTLSRLQDEMAGEIESSLIDVVSAGDITIIRFPDQVSFMSGSGELLDQFLPIMKKIVVVLEDALKEGKAHIIISGHTDDIPITTERYRSNWDLSAARAASVAHYLLANSSISSSLITVQGYADSRPLLANTSPSNRAANRRVEISIQRSDGNNKND